MLHINWLGSGQPLHTSSHTGVIAHRGERRCTMRTSQAARRTGTRWRIRAYTSTASCSPSGTLAARLLSGAVPARPCK